MRVAAVGTTIAVGAALGPSRARRLGSALAITAPHGP